MEKVRFPCELALPLGLVLMASSVCLLIKSGLGVTVMSSVPLMLHYIFPVFEFGVWSTIFNIAVMLLAVVLIKKPRPSYIMSIVMAVFYGILIDILKAVIFKLPESTMLSLIYFLMSMIALSVGIAFSIKSRLPLLPNDVFIRDAVFIYRVRYKKAKTIYDITCLSISLLLCFLVLGGLRDIGLGTIISAIIIGSCVAAVIKVLDKALVFEPLIPAVGRFVAKEEKRMIMRRNTDEDCDQYESFPITSYPTDAMAEANYNDRLQ